MHDTNKWDNFLKFTLAVFEMLLFLLETVGKNHYIMPHTPTD